MHDSHSQTESQRASGYQGIWYALGQKSEYGDKYSGGLGTYTANHIPVAVYAKQVERTYFVYGGTSPVGSGALSIMISYYDHQIGKCSLPVEVYRDESVNDPHDNASVQIDRDGFIWVFKSGRGRRRPGLIFRSKTAWEIDAFDLKHSLEMTYPQVWYSAERGFFVLFTKYTAGRELYWMTSEEGGEWTEGGKLAGMGGHYQVSGQGKDRFGTFFNYHPGGNVDKRTNLYYVETRDWGKTWQTAGGQSCELPLEEIQNEALVFPYEEEGRLMYTCDLNFDALGNPVLLYVTSTSALPGPEGDAREWTIAHWKNNQWVRHVVTQSTHNYDMGSLYIEDGVWSIIGPTKPGPQYFGTGGEMLIWQSEDEGMTWKMVKELTSASVRNHSYARRPLNAKNPFYVFWADGNSEELSESHLHYADSEGQQVVTLPYWRENY